MAEEHRDLAVWFQSPHTHAKPWAWHPVLSIACAAQATPLLDVAYGGEVGSISQYSELSSASPRRAGMRTRSSFISVRVKTLRNLMTNWPDCRWPSRICS